jgi:hypothetical protein
MTPRRTETDGFFVSALMRRAEASAVRAQPDVTETTVTEW